MQLSLDPQLIGSSPHIVKRDHSTKAIMLDVVIALIPVIVFSVFFFGYLVLVNIVVCILSCFLAELCFNLLNHRLRPEQASYSKSSVHNLSFLVTAILLALNLPVYTDIWGWSWHSDAMMYLSFDTIIICIVGSIFAIVVCKMLFGGLGQNFANPACTTRVFLLIAFTGSMMAHVPNLLFGANTGGLYLTTGASWLGMTGDSVYNTAMHGRTFWNMFIGYTQSAAVGETSVFAIILGYGYLVFKKRIDWRLPLILIGATAIFAMLFGFVDNRVDYTDISVVFGYSLAQVMSGGLIFGAVFMATDYSTSPNSFCGNIIFVCCIAFFTIFIRTFSAWQEGFSFALLLGNVISPMIDRYVYPRKFGLVKHSSRRKFS
ncbi:MAG: RnfABCDGE type electron transport complex subunit D [Firmicutes bacterium]|nr:RnfABCDGE type electron transport complex subunit D [Bacillota bacterium]MCL1953303.1 RnfABCDGE type electron transport complex subunit D [Bacillota bacterium]